MNGLRIPLKVWVVSLMALFLMGQVRAGGMEVVRVKRGLASYTGGFRVPVIRPANFSLSLQDLLSIHSTDTSASTSNTGSDIIENVNGIQVLASSDAISPTQQPLTNYDRIIIIHAIVASSAWLVISPLAVLIARAGRNLGKTWFNLHRSFQLITTILTFVAVGLGIWAAGAPKGPHQVMGFFILVLVMGQVFLGWWIHRKLDTGRKMRPTRNIIHIFLGLTISALGYVQVHTGLTLYSQKRTLSSYFFTLFWILAFSPLFLYLCSLLVLVVERRYSGMSWGFSIFGLGKEGREVPGEKSITPFDLEKRGNGSIQEETLVNISGPIEILKGFKSAKPTDSFGNRSKHEIDIFNKEHKFLTSLRTIQTQSQYSNFFAGDNNSVATLNLNLSNFEQETMQETVKNRDSISGLKELRLTRNLQMNKEKVYDPVRNSRSSAPPAKQLEKLRKDYEAAEEDSKAEFEEPRNVTPPPRPPFMDSHERKDSETSVGTFGNPRSIDSTPTLVGHASKFSNSSSSSAGNNHARKPSSTSSIGSDPFGHQRNYSNSSSTIVNFPLPPRLNHARQISSASTNSSSNSATRTTPGRIPIKAMPLSPIRESSSPTIVAPGSVQIENNYNTAALDFYSSGIKNSIIESQRQIESSLCPSPLGTGRPPREKPPRSSVALPTSM